MEKLSGLTYPVYMLHPYQVAQIQGSRGFPHRLMLKAILSSILHVPTYCCSENARQAACLSSDINLIGLKVPAGRPHRSLQRVS